jgi:hypothetical protein
LGGEKEDRPAAGIGKIVLFAVSFIARTSNVATTIVNATLDFNAGAAVGMSKVKTIAFGTFGA